MKKKEILLNVSLIFLIFLTIVQASLLWIKIPTLKNKPTTQEQYNTEDFFKEILKPKKLIINFGDTNHTVLYDFPNTWNEYTEVVSSIFMQLDDSIINSISSDEYLNMQKEQSIVFVFDKELTGNLFLNLIGKSPRSNSNSNIPIKEIYISKNNIVISNLKGIYKLKLNLGKNPESIIENLNKYSTRKYNNLSELYGVSKNIYLPADKKISYKEIYYQDEISTMEKQYKNNLASRVLNQNIDYIREITQANETIYVYEDRFLKILSSGMIIYENPENFEINEKNLYVSLKTAVSFISSKMGISNTITLDKIESIKHKTNYGYRFYFSFTENSIPVALSDKKIKNYISIDAYSDHIKSYKQLYRGSIQNPNEIHKETTEIPLEELINNNINKFIEKNDEIIELNKILENIQDISFVYIDSLKKNDDDKTKLLPAMKINYKDKELFFNLKNGKFIMER